MDQTDQGSQPELDVVDELRVGELAKRAEIQILCKYLFAGEEDDLGSDYERATRRELKAEIVLNELLEVLKRPYGTFKG